MKKAGEFYKVSNEQYMEACVNFFGSDCSKKEAYNTIKLPTRATVGSAGYDFFAPFDFSLNPGEEITVPTGIRAKIEEGYVLMIFPRSGLGFKYRLTLNNTVGIIDSDYYMSDNEGHIMIRLTNCSETKPLEVKSGSGFAQGLFVPFGITYSDNADGIRNGGFGSTTKNKKQP